MEEKIYSAFDDMTMSEECAQKIRQAFADPVSHTRKTANPVWRFAAAAAVMLFALTLFFADALQSAKANHNAVEATTMEATEDIHETYSFYNGLWTMERGIDERGQGYGGGSYYTCSPNWLTEYSGRLYFTANREWTDITDLISNEEPFTYIYSDEEGFNHYIAVGGTYDPEKGIDHDTVFWAEWLQLAAVGPDYPLDNWLGGYGHGYWNNDAGEIFGWYEKAKDILGVPWS